MPEISCYIDACRHLREGRRARAFMIVGQLLKTELGRPLARHLLAQLYPDASPAGLRPQNLSVPEPELPDALPSGRKPP
jgi:hypothetical protein